MDVLNAGVIVVGGLASLGLILYAIVLMPRQFDRQFMQSLKAFSTAIELRIPSRKGWTEQVVAISKAIAERKGVSGEQLRNLEIQARLRDVGLCAVPYSVCNKEDRETWTETDRTLFDTHGEISASMLEMVPSLHELAPGVRLVDAKFGPEQPLESRILKVSGDYVGYAARQGEPVGLESIRAASGDAYDPDLVSELEIVLTSRRGR